MKENLTVSDSKTSFHEQFPFVIPNLYKRIVDEMLVELNLLNHQSEFILDSYFCVGLTETFKELTSGYEPEDQVNKLFDALCKSTNFDPTKIKELSAKNLEEHKSKDLEDIFNKIIENYSKKPYYSRILILGIYKILTIANDFKKKDDIKDLKIIGDISNKLDLPITRVEKDISLYLGSLKKFEQAKELIRETIKADREKRNK